MNRMTFAITGYGYGCGEVGVGVGMENPTPVQNFTYLEPDSIISSLFVQSVIFCHSCVVC